MPTKGMTRYIGGVSVIPVLGNLQARKLAELLHYRGQDTRNGKNVNYADLRHRTRHNLMFCLLMVI
tara:strand:+ start:196 stop:393 length:198 start_codon:yes stop_codon:yes gene_type:complete